MWERDNAKVSRPLTILPIHETCDSERACVDVSNLQAAAVTMARG